MILKIDRRTWLRGEGPTDSALLRSDGEKCCLGFYALACGLAPENILTLKTPSEVYENTKMPDSLVKMGSFLFKKDIYHSKSFWSDSPDAEMLPTSLLHRTF